MKVAEDPKRGFSFSFRFQSTFGLLLEHPQLRGRRRQTLVTRIPVGSEPSSGCQVSTGRWLINRTFPLLNLRRMDGMMGMATGLLCAGPRGSQLRAPSPPAFHPGRQAWAERRQALTPCPACTPSQLSRSPLGPFLSLFPSLCLHGRLLWPALSSPEPSIARRDLSAGSLHLIFHCDLCVQYSCWGSH